MKNLLKQIIPSWWLLVYFGFPAAASAQMLKASEIQPVNSGLFRSNSQDFFLEGNRQLEQEIRLLLQQGLTSQTQILESDQNLRSEICHKEFKLSGRNFDTISAARIASINTKVKNICQHS